MVNAFDAGGRLVKSVGADGAGRWTMDLSVSKGTNEFSFVAHDHDTGRESQPAPAIVTVPLPATPSPRATPGPFGATPPPSGTSEPGTGPSGTTADGPGASGPTTAAQLAVARPAEGAVVRQPEVTITGTSDARAVRITATRLGPVGADPEATPRRNGPAGPGPAWVPVRSGNFTKVLLLPAGRWSITVGTGATDRLASTQISRIIDVSLGGWWVTVEAPDGHAWIRITLDGDQVEPGHNFRAGERQSYQVRDRIEILTGNERGTVVAVNGERLGPLSQHLEVGTWVIEKGSRTPHRE
jgi:hypothetical protein